MYHTDFVCTYKKLLDDSSDDNDSESLYQAQFLQAFGCEGGYDDAKIREGMKEVRQILNSHSEGQAFLDEAFKQGLPPHLAIFASIGGEEKGALLDTIIRTYYSWPMMDLMHAFVCKIKNSNNDGSGVTKSDWEDIIKNHGEL